MNEWLYHVCIELEEQKQSFCVAHAKIDSDENYERFVAYLDSIVQEEEYVIVSLSPLHQLQDVVQ